MRFDRQENLTAAHSLTCSSVCSSTQTLHSVTRSSNAPHGSSDTVEMEDEPTAVVRFKRRKIGHPRKTYVPDGNTSSDAPLDSPDSEAPTSQTPTIQDESSGSNLKEILRQRKRPQDRMREAARRAAEKKAETLVQTDMVKSDVYGGRFVAQTGQVVDKDDEQM